MARGWSQVYIRFLLTILVCSHVFADDYSTGLTAAEEGDYVKAFHLWKPLANQGNALAERELGVLYREGTGVVQNHIQAAQLFRKSANQGDAKAQFYLGKMYQNGRGISQNSMEAKKWYQKAAEQGLAEAQANLGYLLTTSQNTDYVLAAKWLRQAALQGVDHAQHNLAALYFNGQGVQKSNIEAAQWLTESASQGYSAAQHTLGSIYTIGQGVPEDYGLALKWHLKAAAQGNSDSQYSLGVIYDVGLGRASDYSKAVRWYQKAADQGHTKAQEALDGDGEPSPRIFDHPAIKQLLERAGSGSVKAQYDLANLYFKGQRVDQDYVKAHRWFDRSAQAGNVEAAQARDLVIDMMTPKQLITAMATGQSKGEPQAAPSNDTQNSNYGRTLEKVFRGRNLAIVAAEDLLKARLGNPSGFNVTHASSLKSKDKTKIGVILKYHTSTSPETYAYFFCTPNRYKCSIVSAH